MDTVEFQAIPEPASLGLIALFGGSILFIRRRLMM
ncbi:PEP-CTERM sorting domain-containing protein [Pontiellaceae bacterium B12219]|nr:PEP-CTERM sorting domain-containing protein [Pontiellaceae bacterium B12219]